MINGKGKKKTGGRKLGSPNRVSASIKDAFKRAFDDLGGVSGLVKWAKTDPREFYKLVARLIPTEVNAAISRRPYEEFLDGISAIESDSPTDKNTSTAAN